MRLVQVLSEDEKLIAILTATLGRDCRVTPETNSERWCKVITQEAGAVILDVSSDMDELHYKTLEQAQVCGAPVIVIAGDERRMWALRMVEAGALGQVRKPPAVGDLRGLLRQAFERRKLRTELDRTRSELLAAVKGPGELIGAGPEMQRVYELIRKVMNIEAPVLISGESGTGKELIARAIHDTGRRSNRPFVPVSCGAIPETLIEAELFGHEAGAFTGATGKREGYFEKAADGTLFLDEIGELSAPIQVKLLRVLQQREFQRLGSTKTIPLRARILFATHRDLNALVTAGQFRQDLYYRIHVMNIVAPALRRHREDIHLLAGHFLRKYAELHGKPVDDIEPDAMELLQRYHWPGNIRELENVVQGALIMAEGVSIKVEDLPEIFNEVDVNGSDTSASTFEQQVQEYKIKLVHDAVQQFNGNKSLAAESLSISRTYLYRLLAGGVKEPVVDIEALRTRTPSAVRGDLLQ